jgi:glycerophosphoryl diester phosphodiesterase
MKRFLTFALTLVLATAALASARDVIVIAHRGASGFLPEHTLEAYTMAYALGADFVEPDLVLTQDGVFIALHDHTLNSTTNVEEVFPDRARDDGNWYAIDFTLEEIKRLDVHERARPDGTHAMPGRFPMGASRFEVPTLAEVIELVQGLNATTGRDVGIYPEIKRPGWHAEQGQPMEAALLEELARYGYEGPNAKVFVQSFEAEPLRMMRFELGSQLPLVMLIYLPEHATPDALDDWATFADGVGPYKDLVEAFPELVLGAHERGMAVHPWTFRTDVVPPKYRSIDQEIANFYVTYQVDGVFTDFVEDAVRVLKAMGWR